MTPRALIATDLDRTLIYSRAAAGDFPLADRVPGECFGGRAISFMTAPGLALLARLAAEHVVVPVTTRTPEQLARVRLAGSPPRYAVAANGGVLLVDGVPDPHWTAEVRAALADVAPLPEAFTALTAACGEAWARPPRIAADLFCYGLVDRATMPAGVVPALREWAGPAGWTVSLQGRKLYVVPAPLTKAAAVREVARRTGSTVTLAAGDSLLDIDLLAAADHGVHPGHGEIHDSGWSAPHVEALAASGIRAGDEVLAWFARRAAEATQPARPAATQR
jgi:hydroxymethylpyrimidine pyrophosphatase-like HAD family hydrolase